MSVIANWLLAGLLVLVVFAALLTVIAIYGYKRLVVSFTSLRIYPEFRVNRSSLLGALVGVVTRNFVSAAGGFIKGVKVEGKINALNSGRVPLFLPASEHEVVVEGKPVPRTVRIAAFWLKPGAARVFPIYITLDKDQLPGVALGVLTRGGKIDIEIRSRARLGPFSYAKTTRVSPGRARSSPKPARVILPAKTKPV
jgi:hypothetical protein